MNQPTRLQPLFLVKPGTVSKTDIKRAERRAGICIIECSDPESARYSEPPITADIDAQARAALSLLRYIIDAPKTEFGRGEMTKFIVDMLLKGHVPQPVPPVPPTAKTKQETK